jgi:cell fate (sporulation/competence/biofilm development) regulator YlbF (YheA/YmcA/DUF963 family)
MAREIMPIRLVEPEVREAQETAIKLLREFKSCQDPLTKKVFKGMAFDALEFEAELRSRSRAKEAVKMLHDLQKPDISLN